MDNLSIFKKFNFDNVNFYEKDGNWVGCVGTFIYKEKLGASALDTFLVDAHTKSIKELRKQCIGFYAVIYKIDKFIYVFVDETQLYKLYYYHNGKDYILTNDSMHLFMVLHTDIDPVVAQCCLHIENFIGKDSMYVGIKRLMANEVIIIDTTKSSMQIEQTMLNKYHHNFNSIEEAVEILAEKIKYQTQIKKKLFKNFLIFSTGGLDSRLILASYLYSAINPSLVYMHGNNIAMPTLLEDYKISKEIAKYFKLKLDFCDCSTDCLFDYYLTDLNSYWKYGDLIGYGGGNPKTRDLFFNIMNADFYDCGLFGEMFRSLDELEHKFRSPFTLKDFVNELFFMDISQKRCFENINNIRVKLYEIFMHQVKLLNLNPNNLSKKDCFRLYSYRRTIVDTSNFAIANLSRYSYPILAQKEIYDLVNDIPNKWKLNGNFQLLLIQKMCPNLLNISFFTHRQYVKFDTKNILLMPIKRDYIKTIRIGKKIMKRSDFNDFSNLLIREFCASELCSFYDKIGIYADAQNENFSEVPFLYNYKLFSLVTNTTIKQSIRKYGLLKINKIYQKASTIQQYLLYYKDRKILKLLRFAFNGQKIDYIFIFGKYLFKIQNQKIRILKTKRYFRFSFLSNQS